jgi:Fe2+ transport system protein B
MKRNIFLLIAAAIGLAYGIYIVSYFATETASAISEGDALEMIGEGLATAMVLPHMICVLVAVIFNIVAWAINKRVFALTAGIIYSVSAVLFLLYAIFIVPSIVLSFVGYAKLRKNADNQPLT